MKEITVRDGTIEDVDQIAQIHVHTWQDAYKGILPQSFLDSLSIERRAAQWKSSLNNNQAGCPNGLFVISDDNAVYGFAACGAARDKEFSGYGELFAIYIAPNFQKRGYGYRLFERVKDFLKEQGFNRAYVWSLEKNSSAHDAYEKWGASIINGQAKPFDLEGQQFQEVAHLWEWLD